MDTLEITSNETELLLGSSEQMIIENICSEIIYWSIDSNSTSKFRLKPSDSIVVDYDVYLSSMSYGKEFVVVGRL